MACRRVGAKPLSEPIREYCWLDKLQWISIRNSYFFIQENPFEIVVWKISAILLGLNMLCLSHIQPRAPYDFYHPYDFLPVRPSEAPVGILRRCCSRSHIRLRARTIWHDCTLMVWSNNSQDSMGTPCGACTGIVRAPHRNLQCFSYPTGPVRGPCGTRKGAVRQPYGHVRELTQPELAKLPHGRCIWPYGARTGPL